MSAHEIPVESWLSYARYDYKMFLLGFRQNDDPELAGPTAFHAQQAVEKWLKGIMAHHGMPAPRIHDILGLVSSLEKIYPELLDSIWTLRSELLTPYAVDERYPDPDYPVASDTPDRIAILEATDRFREFAEKAPGRPLP